eukprot:TRINITY_DN1138_c0_g1_i1.p1 TRINITY_DN1138_c0_g1~~TRINITY_DN1138_c0_g1_i1.p1  ORF type:complete len:780 (+),score=126.24 TRINITY_DN1138_c0_g1_i1:1761-4100(+)
MNLIDGGELKGEGGERQRADNRRYFLWNREEVGWIRRIRDTISGDPPLFLMEWLLTSLVLGVEMHGSYGHRRWRGRIILISGKLCRQINEERERKNTFTSSPPFHPILPPKKKHPSPKKNKVPPSFTPSFRPLPFCLSLGIHLPLKTCLLFITFFHGPTPSRKILNTDTPTKKMSANEEGEGEMVPEDDVEMHEMPSEARKKKARIGLGIDMLAAGGNFGVDAMVGKQSTVQGKIAEKAKKQLNKLRDIDMNEEWPEALRRATTQLENATLELKENTQELFQEAAEDILRRVNIRLEEYKDDFLEDYGRPAGTAYGISRVTSDLLTRDTRKAQFLCLSFWVLFIVAWEILIASIRRPIDCSVHDETSAEYLKCYNAEDLLMNLNCSAYRCATPWSDLPGSKGCDTCNCEVCHRCTECLCTVGYGPSQHHVCLEFDHWPGHWVVTVRWAVAGFWIALAIVFIIKYLVGWYIEHRSTVVLYEKDQVIKLEKEKKLRKMQEERDALVGTHVEFFSPPNHLYHPDLVKAAVQQRMEDRQCYYKPNAEVGPLMGEGTDAAMVMLSQQVGDVRERLEDNVNPDLQKVYMTRYQAMSIKNERMRQAKKSRAVGATFSSLKANLGDPWLKEVEQDDIPQSGKLFDLYHTVSRANDGMATPELLVKEMFNARGIHASLPFLRRFLLREPARNQLPITWVEFYSEVSLAKDFIVQIGKGGADFSHYLTMTSEYVTRNPHFPTQHTQWAVGGAGFCRPSFASGSPACHRTAGCSYIPRPRRGQPPPSTLR